MNAEKALSRRVLEMDPVGSREVAAQALRLRQGGTDILSMKGAPFQLPPQHVLEAVGKAVNTNIHPPSNGLSELRQAIALKLKMENGLCVDPDSEIVVTNGAMHALYVTMTSLLDPGDEVLLYSPAFFFYGIIQLIGAVPVYALLREQDDFRFDLSVLAEQVSPRTKAILLNTPVNPTGYVATADDLQGIAALAQECDLLIISDESYEKMVYDGRKHISIGSLPEMSERTVTIHSFTKSYALPQWRVGYLTAPQELTKHFTKILEWMNLTCNHLAQEAACAALTGPQDWVRQITVDFERYRDIAFSGISRIERLSCVKPQGGPFLFLNISQLGVSPGELSRRLLEGFGIPTVPGDYFQSSNHVRLPFGAPEVVIEEAVRRLERAAVP